MTRRVLSAYLSEILLAATLTTFVATCTPEQVLLETVVRVIGDSSKFALAYLGGSIALFVLCTRYLTGPFGQFMHRNHTASLYLNGAQFSVCVQICNVASLAAATISGTRITAIALIFGMVYGTIVFLTLLNNMRSLCLLSLSFESMTQQSAGTQAAVKRT